MEEDQEDKCKVCKQPALFICFKCEKWYCEDHWKKDHCKYVKDKYLIEVITDEEKEENSEETLNVCEEMKETDLQTEKLRQTVSNACEEMKEVDKQIIEEFKHTETDPEQQ